jgi:hypothetical protein
VLHVRSHVDVCDPELRALCALVELREEARGLIDIQLVAFPQQGILSYPDGRELMRRAVALGADVVGGIPHYELTREDGVESVRFAFALAPTAVDALRLVAPRYLVLRAGRVVARTRPAHTSVTWHGTEEEVSPTGCACGRTGNRRRGRCAAGTSR